MREFNFYIFFISLFLSFTSVWSSTITDNNEIKNFDSDYYFLRGYQEFIDKNFDYAADLFYQSIQSGPRGSLLHRTYLYLSLCQFKLRDIKNSSINSSYIEDTFLNSKDLILFNRLKESLGDAYTKARSDKLLYDKIIERRYFFLNPYYGRSSFTGLPERDFAFFLGFGAGTIKKNVGFFLSGELLDLQSTQSQRSYEQKSFNFKTSFTNKKQDFYYLYFSGIQSPMKSQDGISVFGFGNDFKINNTINLFSELCLSSYPNFEIKALSIPQFIGGTLINIFSKNLKSFFFKFGFQVNQIPYFDDTNSTIKSGTHSKYFTELIFKLDELIITPGFWSGSESFGVRNQGALVYSGLEERLSGLSLKIDLPITKLLGVQLNYSSERIKMKENIGASQTFFGSLSLTTF